MRTTTGRRPVGVTVSVWATGPMRLPSMSTSAEGASLLSARAAMVTESASSAPPSASKDTSSEYGAPWGTRTATRIGRCQGGRCDERLQVEREGCAGVAVQRQTGNVRSGLSDVIQIQPFVVLANEQTWRKRRQAVPVQFEPRQLAHVLEHACRQRDQLIAAQKERDQARQIGERPPPAATSTGCRST